MPPNVADHRPARAASTGSESSIRFSLPNLRRNAARRFVCIGLLNRCLYFLPGQPLPWPCHQHADGQSGEGACEKRSGPSKYDSCGTILSVTHAHQGARESSPEESQYADQNGSHLRPGLPNATTRTNHRNGNGDKTDRNEEMQDKKWSLHFGLTRR